MEERDLIDELSNKKKTLKPKIQEINPTKQRIWKLDGLRLNDFL